MKLVRISGVFNTLSKNTKNLHKYMITKKKQNNNAEIDGLYLLYKESLYLFT